MKTHGMWKSKEWNSWNHMKGRCNNPNHVRYPNYGAKGITVYTKWSDSFEEFLKDVGLAPSSVHTIDRYPNKNGNYQPGNVRWATPIEQSRNTKRNKIITYKGETKTATEWANTIGISRSTFCNRVRNGMSETEAIEAGRIR